MDEAFTPSRLLVARKRRGQNKQQTAELAGITSKTLSKYETGKGVPPAETLDSLSAALKFPRSFFGASALELPTGQEVSFRSLARMRASEREAALAAGALAFDFGGWIEDRFKLPEPQVPDFHDTPPEEAAAALRERWGLGVRPVRSVVHLLEAHGVRVFSMVEQSRDLDAFSLWRGGTPYCFLNTIKSAEHGRFDAAHELGHLVLHRHGRPDGREAEHEANQFASAFLMPKSTVRATIPRGASLATLVRAKSQWMVSAAALAKRASRVGVLSEWQYRSLCIEMSSLGYRTREPQPMTSRETSQVLDKVFRALHEDGVSRADVARDLHLHVADLESMVFGLVMTAVPGGTPDDGERVRTRKQHAPLRLVQ